MIKKSIFGFILLSLLILQGSASADTIYSKSGNVYQGKIVSVSLDGTEIETNNGTLKIDKNDIKKVSFGYENIENLGSDPEQIETSQDYSNYQNLNNPDNYYQSIGDQNNNEYNYIVSNTESVKLENGTVVKLQLLEKVTSKKNNAGDIVHLEVMDNIIKDGKVLIPAGSQAFGEVTESKKNGMLAKGGKLGLQLKYVIAADESIVPLRGIKTKKGDNYQAEMIALSVIFDPTWLLMKGGQAKLNQGTKIEAFVDKDCFIQVK